MFWFWVLKSKCYCEGFVVTPSCSLVVSICLFYLIASPACLHLGDCIHKQTTTTHLQALAYALDITGPVEETRLFVSQTSG